LEICELMMMVWSFKSKILGVLGRRIFHALLHPPNNGVNWNFFY
jgi:hypothetical protein